MICDLMHSLYCVWRKFHLWKVNLKHYSIFFICNAVTVIIDDKGKLKTNKLYWEMGIFLSCADLGISNVHVHVSSTPKTATKPLKPSMVLLLWPDLEDCSSPQWFLGRRKTCTRLDMLGADGICCPLSYYHLVLK